MRFSHWINMNKKLCVLLLCVLLSFQSGVQSSRNSGGSPIRDDGDGPENVDPGVPRIPFVFPPIRGPYRPTSSEIVPFLAGQTFYGKSSIIKLTLDSNQADYKQLLTKVADHTTIEVMQFEASIAPHPTLATPYRLAIALVVVGRTESAPPGNLNTNLFDVNNPKDEALGYHEIYDQNQINIIDFHYFSVANQQSVYRIDKTWKFVFPMSIPLATGDEICIVLYSCRVDCACGQSSIYNERTKPGETCS